MKKSFKWVMVLLMVLVLMVAAYAFAASNTVPDSYAGDGEGAVSGYTVSSITYGLDATDPSTITSVTFTLDAAAGTGKVHAQLADATKATTAWSTGCTASGMTWTCSFTGFDVLDAYFLRVVAAQ
jgi:hypothetical protein